MATLTWNQDLNRFEYLTSGASERWPAKQAGFRYDANRPGTWYTDQQHKAAKLVNFADGFCRTMLEEADQQAQQSLEASSATDSSIDVPAPDGLEYRGFQKAGIAFANSRPSSIRGALIADEMGLGKTIQAIGCINSDPSIQRVLVIVPASLKLNWKRELKKWLTRPMSVGIVQSKTSAKKGKQQWPGHANVVIINYDLLTKNRAHIEPINWDMIIVDECHYTKNPKAQRTKVIMGYKAGTENGYKGLTTRRWVLLTGTPIVNRPKELFNLLRLLEPSRWHNFLDFAFRYCAAKQTRWGLDATGASNLEELHQILRSTVMVRRLKSQVLAELPPKQRSVIEVPSNGSSSLVAKENQAYQTLRSMQDELRRRLARALVTDDREGFSAAVAELEVGVTAAFDEFSKLRKETAEKKVELLAEHLADLLEQGEKVVVFAHHHNVVDRLMKIFGDKAVRLDGRMNADDKQKSVDRFQTDPSIQVFVGSITAAGVGITLTAASHVVFVELDWVPGNLQQAEDRCHRIGQTDSVNVEYFVLEGSIDAHMAQTVVNKLAVIEKALDKAPAGDFLHEGTISALDVHQMIEESKRIQAEWDERQRKAEEEARKLGITPEMTSAIHQGLRMLARVCDYALAEDEMGFNAADAEIGHSLAEADALSVKQVVYGHKLITKYRRQLPVEILEQVGNIDPDYLAKRKAHEAKVSA